MDPAERLRLLFAKYLSRTCTPGEVAELITLLQRAEADDALSRPMEALWKELRKEALPEYEVDWERMYETIRGSELTVGQQNALHGIENGRMAPHSAEHGRIAQPSAKYPADDAGVIPLTRRPRRILRYAAAAILLLAASSGAYWLYTRESPAPVVASNNIGNRQLLNKKQVIHLPDGSTVILNANSKLDFPKTFSRATRDVYLTGEAYFDVTHRAGQPFLVHTGKITTRVLGTAFDVRAYPADDSIRITVTQGKVQVLKDDIHSMGMLTANQQISYSKLSEAYAKIKQVDVTPVIAWKPREINFDDVTMQQAATELEQRFHVEIVFAKPALKDYRLTATFYEDDTLNEILTVICTVSYSNFTIQDNKITIDGK